MTELDLTRAGLQELGEGVTNERLAAYARERHGTYLDPRFIPLYRATIKGEGQRRRAREEAARIVAEERQERGK
jgi:hypothetical protein